MSDIKKTILAQIGTRPIKLDDIDNKGYTQLLVDRALFELANEKKIEIDIYSGKVKLS